MPNTKDQTASPGTHIAGPIYIEAHDPAQTDFTALNAAITALTDSTGATADNTIADTSTAVTGVDGTGSNAASKADVDTRLGTINNNFGDLAAKVNELRSDLEALKERIT